MESELNFNQTFKKEVKNIRRNQIIKECFYHNKNECCGDIKNAHSVQKNGRLSLIESNVKGQMSVFTPTEYKLLENDEKEWVPIGKNSASTFYGFCDYHDNILFDPIENHPIDTNNYKHLFLHSYRSLAHSYHRKLQQANQDITKSVLKDIKDIEEIQKLANIAISEFENLKKKMESYIENSIYDELEYFVFKVKGLFPLAVSSVLQPETSFKGRRVNNFMDLSTPITTMMLTIIPDLDYSVVIICAFKENLKAVKFLEELKLLYPLQKEIAMTTMILDCENVFLSPIFYQKLSKQYQKILIKEFEYMFEPNHKPQKFHKSCFNFFEAKYRL